MVRRTLKQRLKRWRQMPLKTVDNCYDCYVDAAGFVWPLITKSTDIVRHAQRYDIANKTATNTFFNSSATLFPLTYLQLNTNIKPVRMSNNECPENWNTTWYCQ